ncbi:MAG: thiol:disulfide interchange protein DsbA/DsbL [Sedimenticola sp.]
MKKSVSILFMLLLSLALFAPLQALGEQYQEDVHYSFIIPEQPGAAGGRVMVMEFFWYGCPHCYSLEPFLEKWLETKPEHVDFVRFPALLSGASRILHGKTFYALKMMGLGDSLHEKIFHAMHDKGMALKTQAEMEEFLEGQGVAVDEFRKLMNSNGVKLPVRRAAKLAGKYDVNGVPAIVIDGKYRIGGLSGNVMMDVTDHLIAKIRAEKVAK